MRRKKRAGNITTKQKTRVVNVQSLSSPHHPVLRFLRAIDRNIIVFLILLVVFLFFGTDIKLNMKTDWPAQFQIRHMNPDARLYYSLAENIVDGTGYYDTYRKKQIMPTIGHPLLLAVCCVVGGLSPAEFAWVFLFTSFVFLGLGVRIYTKSNVCVFLALWLYGSFFQYVRWLSGNVEASIIFSNTALFLSLAYLYKSKFNRLSAVIAGAALAVNLLIRPMYLFPTHFFFFIFLVIILYHYIRKRGVALSGFVKGWFILLITAEAVMLSTYTYSHIKYKDSRLVTGTYGSWALYAGNNIYVPPEGKYMTRHKYSEEFIKMTTLVSKGYQGIGWQERRRILMREVIDYWKSHPGRALRGWWWRFRQFMGIWSGEFSFEKPLMVFHSFSVVTLLILILVRMIFVVKFDREKVPVIKSLGLLLAALFLLFSALRSVFLYAEFRAVVIAIPFLVTADIILLFEVRGLFRKMASAIFPFSTVKKQAWS